MERSVSLSVVAGRVDKDAGVIRGCSIITEGPARGHRAFVDPITLNQIYSQAKQLGELKVRLNHSDKVEDTLGRIDNFSMQARQVAGDMNFFKAATMMPGRENVVPYLMSMAEESPSSFGFSIDAIPDLEAMVRFSAEHRKNGKFVSPHPDNTENLPHLRIKRLRRADVVGDPAANPAGLFSEDDAVSIQLQADAQYAASIAADDAATGSNNGGSTMNTVEELRAAHPDLVAQLSEQLLSGTGEAVKLAIEGERKRCSAILLSAKAMGVSLDGATEVISEGLEITDAVAGLSTIKLSEIAAMNTPAKPGENSDPADGEGKPTLFGSDELADHAMKLSQEKNIPYMEAHLQLAKTGKYNQACDPIDEDEFAD